VQITVNRNGLSRALGFARACLPARPAIPALAGIRLTVARGALHLAAFDYDTAARARLSGLAARRGGPVLVSGAELIGAVKSLPSGRDAAASLTAGDDGLALACGPAAMTLRLLPAGDYPALPGVPPAIGAAPGLAAALARLAPVASTDATLPALNNIKLTASPAGIELAATDRRRLAVEQAGWTPAGAGETREHHLLAGARALAALARHAAGHAVTIGCQPAGDGPARGQLGSFSAASCSIVTRLYDGGFAPYPKIVAGFRPAGEIRAAADQLAGALGQAAAAAGKNGTAHLAPARAGRGIAGLVITVQRDGKTISTATIRAAAGRPGPLEAVRVSPALLRSLVAPHPGEVTLHWQAPGKPLGITAAGPPGWHGYLLTLPPPPP
jgi:DNA polymerase III subunit beta